MTASPSKYTYIRKGTATYIQDKSGKTVSISLSQEAAPEVDLKIIVTVTGTYGDYFETVYHYGTPSARLKAAAGKDGGIASKVVFTYEGDESGNVYTEESQGDIILVKDMPYDDPTGDFGPVYGGDLIISAGVHYTDIDLSSFNIEYEYH